MEDRVSGFQEEGETLMFKPVGLCLVRTFRAVVCVSACSSGGGGGGGPEPVPVTVVDKQE